MPCAGLPAARAARAVPVVGLCHAWGARAGAAAARYPRSTPSPPTVPSVSRGYTAIPPSRRPADAASRCHADAVSLTPPHPPRRRSPRPHDHHAAGTHRARLEEEDRGHSPHLRLPRGPGHVSGRWHRARDGRHRLRDGCHPRGIFWPTAPRGTRPAQILAQGGGPAGRHARG